MDVQFSEEQELLRDSAREFLTQECPIAVVREQMEDPGGVAEGLWKQMVELGWVGLLVPEAYGGSGLGPVDLAVLMEELGRALAPVPYLSSAVIGARTLLLAADEVQQSELLPRLAQGEFRLALAQLEDNGSWEPHGIQARAEATAHGYRIDGHKLFVPDAQCADRILVVARCGDSGGDSDVSLFLVDPAAPGVTVRPIAYNEQIRKVCEVRLEGVELPESARLRGGESGWAVLQQVHDHAKAALTAELAGGATKVLEMTVEYAKTREQFGQPIGRFQAIQHKCADMLVKTEGIRSAAYYAAWALDANEPDAHTSACLAKSYATEAYTFVASEGIQVHGGLGFTWEQDPHLYFKHAQAAEFVLGDATYNRELAARELIGGQPVVR
jgi:alkylation response protein AidB-like acyl-CoA dehydrogenase